MKLIFSVLSLVLISSLAFASKERQVPTFSCKGGWIKKWMEQEEVVEKCGKPYKVTRNTGKGEPSDEIHTYKTKRSISAPYYLVEFSGRRVKTITEVR